MRGSTWPAEGAWGILVHLPYCYLKSAIDTSMCNTNRWGGAHVSRRWSLKWVKRSTQLKKKQKKKHKMWKHLQALCVSASFLSFDTVYKSKQTREHRTKAYCFSVSQGIHKRLVLSWQGISSLQLVFLPRIGLPLSPFPPSHQSCNSTVGQ